MSKSAPEWVKVDVEVVGVNSGWGAVPIYGPIRKITAVLGNGNFRIEGNGQQQWSPHLDGTAHATGSGYGRPVVRIVTDELRADIAKSHRYRAASKILSEEADRLQRISRSHDIDAVIAEAVRLRSQL